jgi:hypothetical protein
MSFFKLSGLLQDFFARRQAWLVAGLLLAASGFTANAQTSASNQRAVLLNVVAVDSAGNPVPDLKASEFAVFDNGSPRQIASVRLNQSDKPGPLVVLFDLMNSGESSRGVVWNAVKTSLAHFPSTGPLYLYLLVEDGSLYPVHALPGAPVAQAAVDASWVKDIGPLMDAAMQKVSQVRPVDFRAVSGISLQPCFTHRHLSRAGRYARAYGSVAWPQGTAMGHLRYSKHYSPCGSDLV